MTEDEAEMEFIIEWVIRFEVKETLRGWYKHMEKRYGICQPRDHLGQPAAGVEVSNSGIRGSRNRFREPQIHPDLAQLRCRDLGLIRVRPLR